MSCCSRRASASVQPVQTTVPLSWISLPGLPVCQGLRPINPWALTVRPVSINATVRLVVAVRNDLVIVLLLSGGVFRLALEQIGCQGEGQAPKAQEAEEFSSDSCRRVVGRPRPRA